MENEMERHLFTEGSRGNWGIRLHRDKNGMLEGTKDFLRDGALLRIADALELMTKDKGEMEREISKLRVYENAVRKITDENNDLKRRNLWHAHSNSALRGIIGRLKKQAKKHLRLLTNKNSLERSLKIN